MEDGTIAALATAPGPAGVAVIRISGGQALSAADRLCTGASTKPSALSGGMFRLYRLFDPEDGSFLDEAILLVFRAPHSYTGEDVAEIQVHGGRAVPARILKALYAVGVSPAAPGEFTRRAFLNGRLSLEKAEAVMDLVGARSERAARSAAELLSGALGSRVNAVYDRLMALCADLEATLDFSDEDVGGILPAPQLRERLSMPLAELDALIGTFREGRLLREGALLVLAGSANAGKSTLFNTLLGTNRAIVANQPGTTRDSIEESFYLDGIVLRLVDTAGFRTAGSEIEQEGIDRARSLVASADVLLHLIDSTSPDVVSEPLLPVDFPAGTPVIRIYTKADRLSGGLPAEAPAGILISAVTGQGIPALLDAIRESLRLNADRLSGVGVAVNERHADLLRRARQELLKACAIYDRFAEDGAVPAASHLRTAATALGSVTGRFYTEDLLDTVFSRFCVGK